MCSVIVDYLYVVRVAPAPAKNDPPLIVDANTVHTFQISTQRFKPIARWDSKILEAACCLNHVQLSKRNSHDVWRYSSHSTRLSAVVQVFRTSIAE